jgi:hypothetical protein
MGAIRTEAGFWHPHKAGRINAGFSARGMAATSFAQNPEFFSKLFSRSTNASI